MTKDATMERIIRALQRENARLLSANVALTKQIVALNERMMQAEFRLPTPASQPQLAAQPRATPDERMRDKMRVRAAL